MDDFEPATIDRDTDERDAIPTDEDAEQNPPDVMEDTVHDNGEDPESERQSGDAA